MTASKHPGAHLTVPWQGQFKAARQQMKQVTTSFALICSKFQDRFQSEELERSSASTELALSNLQVELEQAQHEFCLQQKLLHDTATLVDHHNKSVQLLRAAIIGTTSVQATDSLLIRLVRRHSIQPAHLHCLTFTLLCRAATYASP